MEKMAVVAPIPKASISTAVEANPGDFSNGGLRSVGHGKASHCSVDG